MMEWDETFKKQWIYEGKEIQNYIADIAGNALIIINHDGGISGHHSHSYLAAINKETGKEIWSVYAGYLGSQYSFSKDFSKIFVAANISDFSPHMLYCIDQEKGSILWEKTIQSDDRITGIASVKEIQDDFMGGAINGNNFAYFSVNKLCCMDIFRGAKLWETPFELSFDPFYLSILPSPLLYKNILIVPNTDKIFVFNKNDGSFTYQVVDYKLPLSVFPDVLPLKMYIEGNMMYVSRLNNCLETLFLE